MVINVVKNKIKRQGRNYSVNWGCKYSYIGVLPDEDLLKSVVIKVDFTRNSSGRTRIYEYSPPPPPPNKRSSYGPERYVVSFDFHYVSVQGLLPAKN